MSSSLVETVGMHADALLAIMATRLAPAARERVLMDLSAQRPLDELHVRRALVVFAASVGEGESELALPDRATMRRRPAGRARLAHHMSDEEGAPPRWIRDAATLEPQADGDIGACLVHALRSRLEAGADRVVLLGASRCDIGVWAIDSAFAAMRFSTIVCGPCADGGIYLLGASRLHDELLSRVPWGTPDTLAELLCGARERRLSVTLLPVLPPHPDGRITSPVS